MLLLYKDKIINKLIKNYPKQDRNLIKIILFGSVAKEKYTPTSDIDILLITTNKKATKEIFANFKIKILLQYSVIINAMYATQEEYKNHLEPIYKKIEKEGIILWERKKTQKK